MQRVIIFLIALQFLFACGSDNKTDNTGNAKETQSKVKATVSDSSVNIAYAEVNGGDESDTVETENNTEGEAQPLEGIISKTGNAEAKRGTIEDEDKALKMRRARTAFNNGTTYYKQGELEKAIEAFKTALELKPDNSKTFYNLGKIYYDMGQKHLSLAYYRDAVVINPGDSLSLVAVGLLFYEKGDLGQALKYYNKTIEVAPCFSMAYFNRGTMFGQQKKYKMAILDLTKAIKYEEGNSESYVNRGLAYYYTKQMELACKDWHKAAAMGNSKGIKAVGAYCSGEENK